jgi:hypothetical protein
MIFGVNSDYFLKQRWTVVDISNGEVLCFLWGKDWILKYYLDELRLQSVILDCTSSHVVSLTGTYVKQQASNSLHGEEHVMTRWYSLSVQGSFPFFMDREGALPCSENPPLNAVVSGVDPFHTFALYFFKMEFSIILLSTPWSPEWSVVPRFCE